ncbi:DUF1015 domain-containing protein [Thermospira aquatica]|uniref:DUF1015 domain-containing protein n=1 Tax=Thermospira aquatica TaxID=2828656 RepID=A0AAX3BEN8_9SPIR|nr:DUF1015 family protein [Thermospira aquatica]URA10813.1 DUF1015 domain-containing protein [Thermospira aquatica]
MVVRPFVALRPPAKYITEIQAPPYDVMSREEAAQMIHGNEKSFLRITRPDALHPDWDEHDPRLYEEARQTIQDFRTKGWLLKENKPCFYFLWQKWKEREQTAVYAAVRCEDYEKGDIRRHELTRKDKEEDRTTHIATTKVGTGPVFLTFRDLGAWEGIKNTIMAYAPEYHFIDQQEVEHKLWIIESDEMIATIQEYFEDIEKFYIADGHHRAASAYNVWKRYGDKGEGYAYFMAALFPSHELAILPYHRLVLDLNGMSSEKFLERLAERFALDVSSELDSPRKGVIGMYLDGETYHITIPSRIIPHDPIESLDVSLLQRLILHPMLGIDDPRTSQRIRFVGGIRGTQSLKKAVDNKEAAVAFAMYPVSMDELLAVADANKIMPPKSTWFEPKLKDGMLAYPLEEAF